MVKESVLENSCFFAGRANSVPKEQSGLYVRTYLWENP